MSKEQPLVMEGVVDEILPNAMFRVTVEGSEKPIIAVISGRMRMNNIKVLMGDRVEMECSPYDLSRGRITRRK